MSDDEQKRARHAESMRAVRTTGKLRSYHAEYMRHWRRMQKLMQQAQWLGRQEP